ncbi:MAG: M20/M25/M40 family metallo-hydrolase [Clostridia bacterium]|nr:M20/M25/M40 family metallo-hydrolase [Clostridia bacterium]
MTLKELIISLSGVMSISGSERKSGEELKALIGGVFDEYRSDALGNHLFIKRCGRPNAPKILIDTHFDEIGMMVSGIKEGGFVSVAGIGGVDTRILPASEVTIYGKETVYGVFAAKAPHLSSPAERDRTIPLEDMLIDTGYSKEELEELCPLGTPVGFKPVYAELLNDRLAGKAFDDKACGACAVFGIDAVQKRDMVGDVYFLFSAQEETGLKGARVASFGMRPDYALVLDVTHAAVPEAKDRNLPELGSGVAVAVSPIINRRMSRMVIDMCRSANIPFTVEPCPGGTGTNANVTGISAEGIPTALCSLPLKSMHTSAEVLSVEDARALSRVVSQFIKSKEISEVFGK